MHIDDPKVHRESGVFMDDNTPKALCSKIKADFYGHGERINVWEDGEANELGNISRVAESRTTKVEAKNWTSGADKLKWRWRWQWTFRWWCQKWSSWWHAKHV